MYTRILENPQALLRASVISARVKDVTAESVMLTTTAVSAAKRPISSADAEMMDRQQMTQVGANVGGTVQLDVVSPTVFRVRYAEGDSVSAHHTPMLLDTPTSAVSCAISVSDEQVTVLTDAIRIVIKLSPFRIDAYAKSGEQCCGISGAEKNYFCNWDAYNTGICHSLADGRAVAVESFDLPQNTAVYGFGEHFVQLNKIGQTIDLNISDALGVTTPRMYKSIPFFMTTAGYGVFFNHSSLMTYWVGSRSATDIQVAADDDFLDYFVFIGDMKEILSAYTQLTGRGAVPPKWTFGYWQSKISYQSAEETLEIARQLRAHDVPCDVIHLDTFWFKEDWYCDLQFDADRFPDPHGYLQELARLGIKVSLWQLPYIPEGSQLFNDLKAVDGFVKTQDGDIYNCGICFTPGFTGTVGIVDYTNPAAVRVHQEAFRRLFRLGVRVIKTDFGEAAPLDGIYYDGTPGHQMHNLYPLLYNKALFEVTREETGEGVVWARSAWAGSQRYPLHWGGDNSPNYANMAPQLAGGLSFGLSGFQFWSQDIGGFLGKIDERLLIRWMQLGMFLSHSRIHGSGDREIYKFSPETLRICRDALQLRYRLIPYIYGSARQCVEQSLPLARPLALEYQDDPTTYALADEYLFGDSLLVAPILTQEDHRRVYLPTGVWTDWWTKARITGRRWLTIQANIETIPLYIREGALIPMAPVMPYIDAEPVTHLDLLVSLFAGDGETCFDIPVNDTTVPVSYRAESGRHTLSIGKTDVEIAVTVFGEGALQIE